MSLDNLPIQKDHQRAVYIGPMQPPEPARLCFGEALTARLGLSSCGSSVGRRKLLRFLQGVLEGGKTSRRWEVKPREQVTPLAGWRVGERPEMGVGKPKAGWRAPPSYLGPSVLLSPCATSLDVLSAAVPARGACSAVALLPGCSLAKNLLRVPPLA